MARMRKIKTVDPEIMDQKMARLRPISNPTKYPRGDEIVEALDSGDCPRCGLELQIDSGSGLCWSCHFAF